MNLFFFALNLIFFPWTLFISFVMLCRFQYKNFQRPSVFVQYIKTENDDEN